MGGQRQPHPRGLRLRLQISHCFVHERSRVAILEADELAEDYRMKATRHEWFDGHHRVGDVSEQYGSTLMALVDGVSDRGSDRGVASGRTVAPHRNDSFDPIWKPSARWQRTTHP